MTIAKHLPALQVLIPFFAALLCALSSSVPISRRIAFIAIFSSFCLSIYGLKLIDQPMFYAFGNWQAPIGIEYRLDTLNQPIIMYINGVLLFLLLFCNDLINKSILETIGKSKQHLFYPILLFAHSGYLGMLSTNDLFNLYVFIEISSLSAYVLMSQGKNPLAVVGAFDYLMLGTIGATLILIGIGFLLSVTGSLNITDIAERLRAEGSNSNIVMTGSGFFLLGAILKTAFFPMHFWMIRAYSAAPAIILTYLASISGLIGIYVFLRFVHFVIDYDLIFQQLWGMLRPLSLLTIILCAWFAFKADNLKKIIVYSSVTQIGYVFILLSIIGSNQLLFQLLFIDGLNKIALFLIVAYFEKENIDLTLRNIKPIDSNNYKVRILVALALISSAGLPISSMFIIKLGILELLVKNQLFFSFFIIIISGALSLLYHYKIFSTLFFGADDHNVIPAKAGIHNRPLRNDSIYGLAFIIILQLASMLYLNQIGVVILAQGSSIYEKAPPLKGGGPKGGGFYSKLAKENPPQSPFVRGKFSSHATMPSPLHNNDEEPK